MTAPWLRSITAVPCQCFVCGWAGLTGDCLGDVDGDGSLGCPRCSSSKPVTMYPAPHENPEGMELRVELCRALNDWKDAGGDVARVIYWVCKLIEAGAPT